MSNLQRQESIEVPAVSPFTAYSSLDLTSQVTLGCGAIGTLIALKLLVDSLTKFVVELRK